MVARPGASAASQAVATPPAGPASRRPSRLSGTISSVPDTTVSATVPVWGSATTQLATPSRTGRNGGKCSSGCPLRSKPSPCTKDRPECR